MTENYISPYERLPKNGETVSVITNAGKKITATFDAVCDIEIWETDYNFEKDEKVLGWKSINEGELIDIGELIGRGCCEECGEGYDNEKEWKYNTHCQLCGYPIPEEKIIKRPYGK
jgi:hypothetical protein